MGKIRRNCLLFFFSKSPYFGKNVRDSTRHHIKLFLKNCKEGPDRGGVTVFKRVQKGRDCTNCDWSHCHLWTSIICTALVNLLQRQLVSHHFHSYTTPRKLKKYRNKRILREKNRCILYFELIRNVINYLYPVF